MMKLFNKKIFFSTMTILLMLSFLVSLFVLPGADAQSTRELITWPFVDAIPKTAGVGQPVLINWGLLNYLYNVNDGWNVTLQITDPNGKAQNYTGKTWSTGTVGRKMSFSEPGNYTLQCFFNGEYYVYQNTANPLTGNYKPSESETVTLQIREGYWKPDYPGHDHPVEYWTRPVDAQLREWWSIMGSWVDSNRITNRYAPWNEAPESAHILWSMPIGDTKGGLAGGDSGTIGFQTGDAYEGKFVDSVIVAGVLYYNRYVSGSPRQTVVAVDLRTGKTLWERDYSFGGGRISRGQILTFLSENNRGTWAYLWIAQGTNMWALDALTGDLKYNMTNVPSGTIYYGPSGEMLKYQITGNGTAEAPYRLLQWNSTHIVGGVSGGMSAWGSRIQGRTFNAGIYDINRTITLSGSPGNVIVAFPGDRVIFATTPTPEGMFLTGISLDPENVGSLLFDRREFKAPAEWQDFNFDGSSLSYQICWVTFSDDPHVGVFWTKENRANYGFSLETGRFLWQTESRIYADAWASPKGTIAYDKFYTAGVGGIVYCYDIQTGEELWTYEATDQYNESYHNENWWLVPTVVSDGKIYFGHFVHSNTVPISRGAPFFALDCETGDLVWEIDGAFRQSQWGGQAIIGDSIIATMDVYDQQIYAIGKGPSEMTVSVSNAVPAAGSTVLVSGTVMDVSPGTESDNLRMRYPNGVPAVGDESMSEWMLYLYKQFAEPMSVTGIEITVYAWDGHQRIEIGTVESDARGRFSIAWTPEEEGDYDIWAYFEGTASYYGDDAKTEMKVLAAPEVPPTVKSPPYGWYILGAAIAIIAVLIIGILLILKKIDNKK